MSETEHNPQITGFSLNSIDKNFIENLVKIYEESVGETSGTRKFLEHLNEEDIDEIKKDLSSVFYHERRFGSKFDTTDSKLVIRLSSQDRLFHASFNPNLRSGSNSEDTTLQAQKARRDFETKVTQYLTNSSMNT